MDTGPESRIERLKADLTRYGQTDRLEHLLQAVRSSYLSAGRPTITLSERDRVILRQLGIGWPSLSEEGNAIAQELIERGMRANANGLQKLASDYPPPIVALFMAGATRSTEICSLRVPEQTVELADLSYVTSLIDLMPHRRVHASVLGLAQALVKLNLASLHSGQAYRGAKWTATFIYFPIRVAQQLTNLAGEHCSLEVYEDMLGHYLLLQRSPVPSLHEFSSRGVGCDRLKEYTQGALDKGAVSTFANEGPAFLVLDPVKYRNLVLQPMLSRLLNALFLQSPGKTCKKENTDQDTPLRPIDRDCTRRPSIIVGDRRETDTGLLGWTQDGETVLLDMVIGVREQEERAHTISVLGIPGFGKSYTLGVILEMALMSQQGVRSGAPIPAVVFHYDQNVTYKPEFAKMVCPTSVKSDIEKMTDLGVQPTGLSDIIVLVPPWRVNERASEFPAVRVEALAFSPGELGQAEWLLLMGVPGSEALYVNQMKQILRKLDVAGDLSLDDIRQAVTASSMAKASKELAIQRLDMASSWMKDVNLQAWLKPGRLVLLDVRDQMIDASDAMRLCLICLNLFQRVQGDGGLPMPKLIVLDEAHKYVRNEFAHEIVTVVNQMRHTATTVVIASQSSDSIPSDVLEKSSIVILHRLTAPNQIRYLKRAVQGLAGVSEANVAGLAKGEAIAWAAVGSDPRVTDTGLRIKVRPRFSQHV